jgi:hypothetical protein
METVLNDPDFGADVATELVSILLWEQMKNMDPRMQLGTIAKLLELVRKKAEEHEAV